LTTVNRRVGGHGVAVLHREDATAPSNGAAIARPSTCRCSSGKRALALERELAALDVEIGRFDRELRGLPRVFSSSSAIFTSSRAFS
jgi:hypothetical protein